MPSQHGIQEEASQAQGIVVPLELEGLRILKQEVQADGKIRVEVIGTIKRAVCPHCGAVCVKQHDVRPRNKRDVPLRGHRVELVLYKRRFWCLHCSVLTCRQFRNLDFRNPYPKSSYSYRFNSV